MFCTLIGNPVVLVTSPLKKFAAETFSFATIKFSAFSAVPKNLKLLCPSASVSRLIKFIPGLICANPAIVDFGINELSAPEIIATVVPPTSTLSIL